MCWIPRCFFWCRWKYMLILCIWNNFVFIINKLINICQVTYALCKYMCNQWINLNQTDVSDYFCYCIFIHHYNITLKLISILYLLVLQKYQEHNSNDASALEAVIELLHHTSELLSLFNDKFLLLHQMMPDWISWTASITGCATGPMKVKDITATFWFNLQSMCLGFQSLVHYKFSKFPSSVIKPAIVNQDCVENHFCQIRSCNEQNDNPTFLQQQSTQNSIRLGQTTISSKSNASCNSTCICKRPSIEGKQEKRLWSYY